MKKLLLALCVFGIALFLASCQKTSPKNRKPQVLCSIQPYAALIREIAGETVDVQVIVPPYADMHTYEPTIRQMQNLQATDLWFYIGEPLEKKLLSALQDHSPDCTTIDLRKDLSLKKRSSCSCTEQDLHIWLSPKLLKKQVHTIEKALSKKYPAQQELYSQNALQLEEKIDLLDQELTHLFSHIPQKSFVISHPSLSYFCADYGLEQLSVEQKSKEPTPQQIIQLIRDIQSKEVTQLFIVPKTDQKKARMLADDLHLDTYIFDPYAADCLSNLKQFAYHLTYVFDENSTHD